MPVLPGSEEEALEQARSSNPRLAAARATEEASRHDVRSIQGELLPTLSVELSHSYNEDTAVRGTNTTTDAITGTLSIPLYQSGSVYARVRQAKQLNSRDKLAIADQRRATDADTSTAWDSLRSAQARIKSDQAQVRANEIAFEGVSQEARVGSRTTLDVLDAEQELLDARVALVRSERDAYVAAYSLLSAVGGLTAAGLSLPVDVYDPNQNFNRVKNKIFGGGIGK